MEHMFRFAHLWSGIGALTAVVIVLVVRAWWYKAPTLYYSFSAQLYRAEVTSSLYMRYIPLICRLVVLILLSVLIARPQWVDITDTMVVEGVDIMLVMDISGSMKYAQSHGDTRSRLEIAKDEAIRFIHTRTHDAMGLVFFANDVIVRCPLTLDKHILQSCVQEVHINYLPEDGTLLCSGIIMAANRLKHSSTKSRIMIVLTDGEPTAGDQDPRVAVEIAKQLGIKIYTIGIGSDQPLYVNHPLYGYVPIPGVKKEFLTEIAQQTGGRFFLSSSAKDMRSIYQTIDQLEKSELNAPIFMKYYDILFPIIWIIVLLIIIELCITTYVWFGL